MRATVMTLTAVCSISHGDDNQDTLGTFWEKNSGNRISLKETENEDVYTKKDLNMLKHMTLRCLIRSRIGSLILFQIRSQIVE